MTEPTMANKLQGKVAIVTGGARGIGEATARLFADHGVRVVVIADIQDELGKRVSESIGSHRCSYSHCDVADEDQVQSLVQSTVQIHGRLDIMFSNAGIISGSSNQAIVDLDFSQYDRLFAVNVRGMAACVKHAARAMVDLGMKGSIVCTASVAATVGGEYWTDYCMSKHAVLGLMRCASKQLGGHGIRVNCVSPYAVATPLMCNAQQKEMAEIEENFRPLTSLKEIALKVSHVADGVLFLVSDDSAFITGHNLIIDGGFTT